MASYEYIDSTDPTAAKTIFVGKNSFTLNCPRMFRNVLESQRDESIIGLKPLDPTKPIVYSFASLENRECYTFHRGWSWWSSVFVPLLLLFFVFAELNRMSHIKSI